MASKLKNALVGAVALASTLIPAYADNRETHVVVGTNYGIRDNSMGVNVGFLSPVTDELKLGASITGYSNLINPITWGVNVHNILSGKKDFIDYRSGVGAMLRAQHTIGIDETAEIKPVTSIGVGFSNDYDHISDEHRLSTDIQASLGVRVPSGKDAETTIEGVFGFNEHRGPQVGVQISAGRK